MGQGRSVVHGTAPSDVVDLTVVPDVHSHELPSPVRLVPAPARRPVGRRSDATGPLSLVPRPKRSPLARAARAVAFPAVVLAVLGLGAWETHRIVLAQQPATTVIASPTLTTAWGRIVVLRAATTGSTDDGMVIDVTVRLVGTSPGTFDPSMLTLRTPGGDSVPATLGAARNVRLAAGGSFVGHLGFVVPSAAGPLTLAVREPDGDEQQVSLRAGAAAAADAALPPTAWSAGR